MSRYSITILTVLLLLCVAIKLPGAHASFLSRALSAGNLFQTATVFSVPTAPASLLFESPTGKNIPTNQLATISIQVSGLGQTQIDGIQVQVILSGTVPTDLTLQAATVPGLTTIIQSVTANSNTTTVNLVFVSSNPLTPYTSTGAKILLGTLQFTSPESGTVSVAVNPTVTKILENGTGKNIVSNQTDTIFRFQ